MDAPMPLDAPVTTATFPASFLLMFVLIYFVFLCFCCLLFDSNLRRATIHEEFNAVDKAAVIRREEHNGFGDFIRRAGATQWRRCGGLRCESFDLLVGQAKFALVGGPGHPAWADAIDANVSAFQIN